MAQSEALNTEHNPAPSIDLGDATEKTLGNNSAGRIETFGPKRYRR